MTISETIRGAMRRLGGSVFGDAAGSAKRRTVALPSILQNFGPRADLMPKATAHNLRRFAETPVARKAINVVKDRVSGMRWRIQPKNGRTLGEIPAGAERVRLLTDNFDAPNPDDTFRSFSEQVLEDVIVGGFGAIEMIATGDPARPLALWPVDGASIQIKSDWDGQPGSPRYAQKLRLCGTGGSVVLNDDELIYVRLNARSHTPFGLGRLEVAFETINAFLCAHRYASKLASNSVAQYALWLQGLSAPQHERLIRWWQDEIEGTGKVPLMTTEAKPEVLRFGGGTDQDLRLAWQEFLMRIIADAFDLPPFLLGVEHDVNRSTAGELGDQAFRSAIVPTARLLAESLSRGAIEKKLGWRDLEFVFTDVDSRNELEEVQIQERLIRCGVLTVDEVREMRGLPKRSVSDPQATS
jgi:phage portal protein BeeE